MLDFFTLVVNYRAPTKLPLLDWILIWLKPTRSISYFLSSWRDSSSGLSACSPSPSQTYNADSEHIAACIICACEAELCKSRTSMFGFSVQFVNVCMTQQLCIFSFSTTFRGRGLFPNPGLLSMLPRWPWHWAICTLLTLFTGRHTQISIPCKKKTKTKLYSSRFSRLVPCSFFLLTYDLNMIHTESCVETAVRL